jgi:hypothetical protein
MTDKINQLNTSYLIPGFELGPSYVEDPEESDQGYEDAPYSQMHALGDIPSPDSWKDMFGLKKTAPGPNQIEPPVRPASEGSTSTSSLSDLIRTLQNVSQSSSGLAEPSPKVKQMVRTFAAYAQMASRIRLRASDGGGQ